MLNVPNGLNKSNTKVDNLESNKLKPTSIDLENRWENSWYDYFISHKSDKQSLETKIGDVDKKYQILVIK